MTDCSAAPAIFIPPWGDAPKGVRAMVMAIRLWADARGSIDCSEAELAAMTGYEAKAVERHMREAVKRGFVSRSERRRGADGRLSGYRYWLSAKLNKGWDHPTNCRVEDAQPEGVDKPVSEPPDNLSNRSHSPPDNLSDGSHPPPDISCTTTRQSVQRDDKLSGGSALESQEISDLPRERARAFPFPFPSSFLSFPWRDEATMKRAEAILSACGPKLGSLEAQDGRVLKSLAYVLEPGGLWDGFDLEADVLPVVKLKTGPGCGRVLWDFALLTENLERHRARRLAPPKRKPAVKPPAELTEAERAARRETRARGLRATIAAIARGEGQPFMLPKAEQHYRGEFLADAYARAAARAREELAGLENEMAALARQTEVQDG